MTLGLFEGYGIELEYMVVDRGSFAVRPVVDELLRRFAGAYVGDYEDGPIAWSNELAMHVVELKTNGPAPSLAGLAGRFQDSLLRLDAALAAMDCRLMPGGMHPSMDPAREFVRWPHDSAEIYAAYDRIFGCSGHGWSNLQSCHLNLPFADDEQFGRLHLAARALLPLLPALAASSPFCCGRATGWLDWRLEVYRHNQARLPRIAGAIVPEPIRTRDEYFERILRPIWRDIEPFDPGGILQHEWLNSRGVVAKWSRDSIEIRLLDVQECPAADLAIAALVVAVLRAMCDERCATIADLEALPTEALAAQLWRVARDGDQAVVDLPELLAALGLPARPVAALQAWRLLAERWLPDAARLDPLLVGPLRTILAHGPLARRMLRAAGAAAGAAALRQLTGQLCDCLRTGTPFGG